MVGWLCLLYLIVGVFDPWVLLPRFAFHRRPTNTLATIWTQTGQSWQNCPQIFVLAATLIKYRPNWLTTSKIQTFYVTLICGPTTFEWNHQLTNLNQLRCRTLPHRPHDSVCLPMMLHTKLHRTHSLLLTHISQNTQHNIQHTRYYIQHTRHYTQHPWQHIQHMQSISNTPDRTSKTLDNTSNTSPTHSILHSSQSPSYLPPWPPTLTPDSHSPVTSSSPGSIRITFFFFFFFMGRLLSKPSSAMLPPSGVGVSVSLSGCGVVSLAGSLLCQQSSHFVSLRQHDV